MTIVGRDLRNDISFVSNSTAEIARCSSCSKVLGLLDFRYYVGDKEECEMLCVTCTIALCNRIPSKQT